MDMAAAASTPEVAGPEVVRVPWVIKVPRSPVVRLSGAPVLPAGAAIQALTATYFLSPMASTVVAAAAEAVVVPVRF